MTERQSSVAKLRGMGYTPADISEQLDMQLATVNSTLKAIYSRKVDENRIIMAREVELNMFDELTAAYLPPALELNKDAASVILQIHDRRSKLMGLEPQKKTVQLGPQVALNFNFSGTAPAYPLDSGPVVEGEAVRTAASPTNTVSGAGRDLPNSSVGDGGAGFISSEPAPPVIEVEAE